MMMMMMNAISDATELEFAATRAMILILLFDEEECVVDEERDEEMYIGLFVGVVVFIVGSIVGVGVLAFSAATAEVGILSASGALIGVWILFVCDVLLLVEVNVGIM